MTMPPETGHPVEIRDGLRMILAANPSPMTHWGTNTWLLGETEVAVIDPGPKDDGHLQAILSATHNQTITRILVTHAHRDHSPLARELSARTGAPVLGFGPPEAGRSAVMKRLAKSGLSGGGEGVDTSFMPDQFLAHGDKVQGDHWTLETHHTPGHFAGHLAFSWDGQFFSGDHAMDWASSLVSPPDGDLGAFMASTQSLIDAQPISLFTGHGHVISDPTDRLEWLIRHRRSREASILAALSARAKDIPTLTQEIYTDVPANMQAAAARNVFAHLIDLVERRLAVAEPVIAENAVFSRI